MGEKMRFAEGTSSKRWTSPYKTDDPLLQLVGNTPLIESPIRDNVFCKLETENPTRSMKDRIAVGILSEAVNELEIDTVVEASSGNTAGSIAFVSNRLGLDCHVTCPETTSKHKVGYMKAFGAEVHQCPDVDESHTQHYHHVARDLAKEHDAYFVNQYENLENPDVHYEWTGPELWGQIGSEMTHLVCAMGTGGTISGVAKYIKERAADCGKDITVVGVDAKKSNISAAFYHDSGGEYDTRVEGLGKGRELPTMWFEYIDEVRSVTDDRAFNQAREAAQEYGLLIGPSAGAALSVSLDIAADPDSTVVTIICDGGEQYFSTLY